MTDKIPRWAWLTFIMTVTVSALPMTWFLLSLPPSDTPPLTPMESVGVVPLMYCYAIVLCMPFAGLVLLVVTMIRAIEGRFMPKSSELPSREER